MRKNYLGYWALGAVALGFGACSTDEEAIGFCASDEISVRGQCLKDLTVATNTVGFLPQRVKKAAYTGSAAFEVVDADSGDVVLEGDGAGPITADGGVDVYSADFSSLRDAGSYYIRAAGQKSGTFKIGVDALVAATDAAMLGLYGQRCGANVSFDYEGDRFAHGLCHQEEASMSRVGGEPETKDDTGGWHDAGDYGKYVRNGAFAVAFLLQAWEHFPDILEDWEFEMPERGGDVPDILDEARVEVEWILKTQFEDGSFSHKVTGARFEGEVRPESDTQPRYFFSTSSHSTGNAVAVLAAAARIYESYDADFAETCLEAARRGQEFLDENPQEIDSEQISGGTGTYASGGDKDERAWALVELWETTGDAAYLAGFEAQEVSVLYNYDWGNADNLAVSTYLRSKREGRNPGLVELYEYNVLSTAERQAAASAADPFGRGFQSYYWGSAGVTVRMAHTLAEAHRLHSNRAYLDGMTTRIDHVLGLNQFARSFVTGVGSNPPREPHHRPSTNDSVGAPWPGLLIGGPNPDPLTWEDVQANYQQNEVAINWNTALVYALVAAQATQEDENAACVPNCLPDPPAMGGAGGGGGAGP
jgi:endoglucanase